MKMIFVILAISMLLTRVLQAETLIDFSDYKPACVKSTKDYSKTIEKLFGQSVGDELKCKKGDSKTPIISVSCVYTGKIVDSADETLVLFNKSSCGGPRAQETCALAVVKGDEIKIVEKEFPFCELSKVYDIDGDSRDELIMSSFGSGQGSTEQSAAIFKVSGKKIQKTLDLGTVNTDNCAAVDADDAKADPKAYNNKVSVFFIKSKSLKDISRKNFWRTCADSEKNLKTFKALPSTGSLE